MNNQLNILAFDLKKYRIRLHKSFLHQLGDPDYVQLLVNPEKKMVAVKAIDHITNTGLTFKVSKKRMESDHSVEIYSRSFVQTLCDVAGGLNEGYVYRLTGCLVESERMFVFSLDTITKVEN